MVGASRDDCRTSQGILQARALEGGGLGVYRAEQLGKSPHAN